MRLRRLFYVLAPALACASLFGGCGGGRTNAPGTNAPAGAAADAADPEPGVVRVLKPLPDNGFKAQITVQNPPARLLRGQRELITVRVKNTSGAEWPMRGRVGDGIYQVNLGDHWRETDGKDVKVDERVFLPKAVKPGEEVEMEFTLVAPDRSGDFVIELDMVQEGVTWFAEKGSEPARLKIKVE